MSAASSFGQPAFDICEAVTTDSVNAPTRNNGGTPKHQQCLFCLFAAQCANHPAMVGDTKAFPAFAVGDVAAAPYASITVSVRAMGAGHDDMPGMGHRDKK
jgi:hypothetical protein